MFLSQSTENGQRKDSSNPNLMCICIRGSTIVLGGPKDNFVGWGRGVGGRGPRPVFDKSTIINKFEISKSVRTPPLDLLMISIYLSVYLHNNNTFHNNSKRYSTFVHRTTRCKVVGNPLCTDRHSIKDLLKFAKKQNHNAIHDSEFP